MDQIFLPEYRRHLEDQWGPRAAYIFTALLGEHRKLARENRFRGAQLKTVYHMDPASLLPAIALDVQPGHQVLDLCAAPGGKTLLLAEGLFLGAENSQSDSAPDLHRHSRMIANEISDSRRTRLKNTVREYVDPAFVSQIRVTGYDASRWGLNEKAVYDRILIDVPCSGDRFFLKKLSQQAQASRASVSQESEADELEDFRPGRTKRLAMRQYAILASAWMALQQGGRVVYSTCSISQAENDKVVAKLLKRQGTSDKGKSLVRVEKTISEQVQIVADALQMVCEPTEYGFIILPDRSRGAGPIYFAKLTKL